LLPEIPSHNHGDQHARLDNANATVQIVVQLGRQVHPVSLELTENQELQVDQENLVRQEFLENQLKIKRAARNVHLVTKANLAVLVPLDNLDPQARPETRAPRENLAPSHQKDQTVPPVHLVLMGKQDPKVRQDSLVKLVERAQSARREVQEKLDHQVHPEQQAVKETMESLAHRVDLARLVSLVQLELQVVQEDPVSPENLAKTPNTAPALRDLAEPSLPNKEITYLGAGMDLWAFLV